MYAEKPAIIEVTLSRVRKEEVPSVIRIYSDQHADFGDVGKHNTFVAHNAKGVVVGAVTIEEVKPGLVKLRTFAVDPGSEGKRIGSQMLESVLDDLKRMGCKTAEVVMPYSMNSASFFREVASAPWINI
jgi:N-acetylglutamate synthase-like GNAT family acetyltransferase